MKAVFELRSACIAGYTPDLSGCCQCGREEADRFDILAGRLECADHRSPDSAGIRMPLTAGILAAMRYICFCDPKRLFSFTLGEDSLAALGGITESYLTTQLERGFSALDFYKSLLI